MGEEGGGPNAPSPLPRSTVPDELSMNRSDSNGFVLRQRICTLSESSSKITDLSLVFVK